MGKSKSLSLIAFTGMLSFLLNSSELSAAGIIFVPGGSTKVEVDIQSIADGDYTDSSILICSDEGRKTYEITFSDQNASEITTNFYVKDRGVNQLYGLRLAPKFIPEYQVSKNSPTYLFFNSQCNSAQQAARLKLTFSGLKKLPAGTYRDTLNISWRNIVELPTNTGHFIKLDYLLTVR
ncbi:hypothetical protein [Endozoicomonas atrinae]|uniref:hypothetical protein n=1 Tax=Endozoicomonas atrinae TaxID=1333660 RepID=UPI000825A338|nr:hypothetical protein [Endozoicomonas atrinae]